MHAAVKPPVVVISRPNSAAANKSDTRAVVPSTPARPANPPGLRSGRPTSCSPVARRRDLVPQQLIQSQRALGTSSFAQAVTGSSATPLVEQRQNQPGRTQESRRAPFDEDEESESSSVFAATLVRKEAEEAVQQLARRIAHYHSQEERVLREVWSAKRTLEVALAAREPDAELMHQATVSSHTRSRTELARLHPPSHLRAPTPILPATPERERVRARDHLQFLSVCSPVDSWRYCTLCYASLLTRLLGLCWYSPHRGKSGSYRGESRTRRGGKRKRLRWEA